MSASRRGTTLIELVVVLLLLGLLMGLVVPALTAVPKGRTARSSVDSVRLAAVRRGAPIAVSSTDSAEGFYALPDGRLVGGEGDSAK